MAAAIALAALVFVAARPGRSRGGPRVCWMGSAQVVLFGLLEATEQLGGGHSAVSVLSDPSFRWGVVGQLVSATVLVALVWLARVSGAQVRALVSRRPALGKASCRWTWGGLRTLVCCAVWVSAVSERGPPGHLAPA